LLLLLAATFAAAPPRARDDDDDRPRRHVVVRHAAPSADQTSVPPAIERDNAVEPPPPSASSARPAPVATSDADDAADGDERRVPESDITVTARRLDAARAGIEPALGAATHTITNDSLENRPGGETRSLGSVLIQAPGIARDARGALVARGASGGLQYRLNNIILPEGAGDFGEALSARLAASTLLITGALPAQYGLAPAGVVAVTTKNGHYLAGGQAELYGGAHGTVEPAVEWSHATGATSLFVSASAQRSLIGLPAPDARSRPLHDRRKELEGFLFADHLLNSTSRVSLIAGSVNEQQQIPALPRVGIDGAERRLGTLAGHSHYLIAAYQLSAGPVSLQASLSILVASRAVVPDERLRLAVEGRSFDQHDRRRSAGTQIEASYAAGADHVLRAGLVANTERFARSERSVTAGQTFDRRYAVHRSITSLFLQDQWAITPQLTANLGVRPDRVGRTDQRTHLQPRVSLVWLAGAGLSAHASYARSIVAAPLDDLVSEVMPLRRVERDDLFDAGIERKRGRLTVGMDFYDRRVRDFIAIHWRSDSPIGDSFSYATAHLRGAELVTTFAEGPVTAWANLALARGSGRGVSGGAAELRPSDAAYVAVHRVPLDTDQRVTLSAGGSLRTGPVLLSASVVAGSGMPRTAPGGPVNGARGPAYASVDMAVLWHLHLAKTPTDLRIDVRNLTNDRASLSDASALAAGAPGYGETRGLYIGIEQGF
jgi:outer membrane receptor protein involved in Fe transport